MKRPSAGAIVRLVVAIGLTALMLWKSNPAAVWRATTSAHPGPILVAVALTLLDRALMAYRWLVLLRPFSTDGRPAFGAVMRIFFVSTFVGTFLPASVGGDAVRAYALSKEGVPGPASLASVLMDRMLGVLSLLIMGALGLVIFRRLASSPGVMLALTVTAGLCAATAVAVFSEPARQVFVRLASLIPWPRMHAIAGRFLDAIGVYATRHGELLNVLAGSIGVQALRIVQAYFLGLSLGITLPLATYFALIPVILLVMLLPVTINGLGVSQAAFVYFFALAGVANEVAFTLSVLFVALGIVGNLPGGLLYLGGGLRGTTAPKEAR